VRSAAGGEQAKPYAYVRQPTAIGQHLDRAGIEADVRFGTRPGLHWIVHRVDASLTASLVLVGGDDSDFAPALARAARSWLTQNHPAWEIALAAPPQALRIATASLEDAGVDRPRIVTVSTSPATDPITALNAAAHAARGQCLVLMDAPFIGLTHDWLRRLLGYSTQPDIAAAGPIVLAPTGRVKHAGVAIADGLPLHLLYGCVGASATATVMNVSAVSGVLATRREVFDSLGGLRAQFGDLALIDYSLGALQSRMRAVIVPDARLRTVGPDPTINDLPAVWRLRNAWRSVVPADPYYHANYLSDRGDYTVPVAHGVNQDVATRTGTRAVRSARDIAEDVLSRALARAIERFEAR
jgi:hypothetical protein